MGQHHVRSGQRYARSAARVRRPLEGRSGALALLPRRSGLHQARRARDEGVSESARAIRTIAIVIDKKGKIRGMFDATSESQCERMHKLLLECLDEKPPARSWRPAQRRKRNRVDVTSRRPSDRSRERVAQCARDRAAVVGLYSDQEAAAWKRTSGRCSRRSRCRPRSWLLCVVPLAGRQRAIHASRRVRYMYLRDPRVARAAGDYGAVSGDPADLSRLPSARLLLMANCQAPKNMAAAAATTAKSICGWPAGRFRSGCMFRSRAWWCT